MDHAWNKLSVPDDRAVSDLWVAPYVAAAMTAAVETGINSRLAVGATTPDQLAADLSLHLESTVSVLRVLTAMGFAEERDGSFVLTEVARAYLVPESPLSKLKEFDGHRRTPEHAYVVKRLKDRNRKVRTFSDALKDGGIPSDQIGDFIRGMDSLIRAPAIAIARSGAFRGIKSLLDVGGGSGAFCSALTAHVPDVEATILDLPQVCEEARKLARERGVQRVQFHGADFFAGPWPANHQAVFFSNVLHDWGDEAVLDLLRRARTAVARGGTIYVLEVLLDETLNGPLMATVFHMQMQMSFDAQQFSLAKLRDLLRQAGWASGEIVAKFGYYSLVKAAAA